jgi:hypothetical protein
LLIMRGTATSAWAARLTVSALLGVLAFASGCGGDQGPGAQGTLRPSDSSWIAGQASLTTSEAYRALLARAGKLAGLRAEQRARELERLARARKLAKDKALEAERRRLAELRRKALARYRAALKAAAEARSRQAKKLAELRAERARELAKLLKQLELDPGKECQLPQVKQKFRCQGGRLPFSQK